MATCPNCLERFDDGVKVCPDDGTALLDDVAFAVNRDLAPGDKVGEYEVTGKLGEGGFGSVFSAVHPLIGKKVAIKVLKLEYSANPQIASRFISEARAVNEIGHRYIIDVFSFGQLDDGRHYFVMSLLDGQPLDALMAKRGGKLSVTEAMPILVMLAEAIDAAHAAGIAHRDLKPENVFVCRDGVIKVLDFGIAKLDNNTDTKHSTRTGAAMGTAAYMSPEQARGRDVDHRTDIYAFGAMTFHLLTGTLLFRASDVMDLLMKQIYEAPPKPSERSQDVPAELDEPILAMLAKSPARRPKTMTAAINGLRRALGEDVPEPEPEPAPDLAVVPTLPDRPGAKRAEQAAPSGLTPSGVAAESLPGAPDAPRRSARILGAVAALGVAGVITIFAVRGLGSSADEEPNSPEPPIAAAPALAIDAAPIEVAPDAGVAPVIDAAPAAVEVRFVKAPKGAEVSGPDGERLGTTPGPVMVPFGRDPVELTLRRARYRDLVVTIRPDRDQKVEDDMTRKRGASRPANDTGVTIDMLRGDPKK